MENNTEINENITATSENMEDVIVEEVVENEKEESINDRAKVLSPGMTVLKRFFRSKLSIVGLITIIVLFLFSFVGPIFSPWGPNQVDEKTENIKDIYTPTRIEYVTESGETQDALIIDITTPKVNKRGVTPPFSFAYSQAEL